MSEPTKCYAVSSGSYSDYQVHAIYRRREDAEARVQVNNSAARWLVDGKPVNDHDQLPMVECRPRYGDTYDLRLGKLNEDDVKPIVRLSDGRAWVTKNGVVAVFPDRLAERGGFERLPDDCQEVAYAGASPSPTYMGIDMDRVKDNPAREADDLRVEEFDYYEGEPLPAPLEVT